MEEKRDKVQVIKETIESTIENAIDTQAQLEQAVVIRSSRSCLQKMKGVRRRSPLSFVISKRRRPHRKLVWHRRRPIMNNDLDAIKKMADDEQKEKIGRLQKIVDTTRHNIEVSDEIIAETPYDAQQVKLEEKNRNRRHAIAGLEKEIRDIEETID